MLQIHDTLQTIKSIVRQSSEKAVTVVNPADYKAVDYGIRTFHFFLLSTVNNTIVRKVLLSAESGGKPLCDFPPFGSHSAVSPNSLHFPQCLGARKKHC